MNLKSPEFHTVTTQVHAHNIKQECVLVMHTDLEISVGPCTGGQREVLGTKERLIHCQRSRVLLSKNFSSLLLCSLNWAYRCLYSMYVHTTPIVDVCTSHNIRNQLLIINPIWIIKNHKHTHIHTLNVEVVSHTLTLAFLALLDRGNRDPAVVVGRTRGDCSTLRILEGAVAGETAALLRPPIKN